jgi:hypothetical protein
VTKYLVLVFGAGTVLIVLGGIARGFDAVTLVILVAALGTGAVGIAIARRFSSGAVGPAQCSDCGGVIAPSSPYCKHCGAPR